MGGKFYNHIDDFYINVPTNIINLSHKWNDIETVQNAIKHVEGYNKLNQTDICLVGSPIYCPKYLTKLVQNVIKYIFEIESIYDGILPNETFYELEEEWPITKIGLDNGGIWNIEQSSYIHGYMSYERKNIDKGIKEAECILGEDVFNKYIK